MSHRVNRRVLPLLVAVLTLAGCSTVSRQSHPEDPALEAFFAKTGALMENGEYERAIPMLKSRIEAYPGDIDSRVNLAIAYRETGQPEQALTVLEQAILDDSRHAAAQHQLGIVQRQLGHFDLALAAYQKAIRLEANYALAHLNLGILYDIYLQQPDAAIAEYEAYQQLSGGEDTEVSAWILDLKRRTSAAQAVLK